MSTTLSRPAARRPTRAPVRQRPPAPPPRRSLRRSHWTWLVAGLVFGFLVPFLFADLLELNRDLFYGVYTASVLLFVTAWIRATGLSARRLLRRRWALGAALGLLAGGVLAAMVLRTEDASGRPDGLELVLAVLWRGVVYGATDGILLSVFPILAVFAAFAGTRLRRRLPGTLAVGALALLAAGAMTATYHLGYGEFRSSKLAKPLTGSAVWSAPTLLTLSPLGAPIAHAAMHVTAVLHSYQTDTFLPPHGAAAASDAAAPAPVAEGTRPVVVYLLRGELLAPAARLAPAGAAPGPAALEELVAGPTAAEREAGLSSAVPEGTRLLGLAVEDGRATVDLSGTFASGGGSLSSAARLAQLVFTVTRLATVDEVVLRLDGRPVQVFGGEGIVLDLPLTRTSYLRAQPDALEASFVPPVLVERPALGAAFAAPLRVTGTASGPFTLTLVDWDGRVVAEADVPAPAEARAPFDVTLRFEDGLYPRGALIVSEGDGAARRTTEIPLGTAAASPAR
jgi:hypothetical protein